MAIETKFVLGQHNMICAYCQAVFKSGVMRKDWKSLWACGRCFEEKPPFLDSRPVKWGDPYPARDVQGPEPADIWLPDEE